MRGRTEGFCTECICNASLADRSPQAKVFVKISRSSKKTEFVTEGGICFNCSKAGTIVYYIVPAIKGA